MRLCLVVVAALAGCQCLVPVDEGPMSVDAGATDSGAREQPERCAEASDCRARLPPRFCTLSSVAPARSCINGFCVYDCAPARTCVTQDTSTTCEGSPSGCHMQGCELIDATAKGQLSRDCGRGPTESLGTFTVRFRPATACGYDVLFSDGGVFAELAMADEYDETVAYVKAEPGVTCTIESPTTPLQRLELGCSECLYLLQWP